MKNTLDNNYIKNTPDFVYVPPQPLDLTNNKGTYEVYTAKFKTSVYGALLFVVLSLPSTYKILDIIAKLFSSNLDIVDQDYGEPLPLGRAIMASFVAILLFVL